MVFKKVIRAVCAIFLWVLYSFPSVKADPATGPAPTEAQKEIARQAEENIRKAQGTPGQEAANFLENDWPNNFLSMLKGESEVADKGKLEYAANFVTSLSETAAKGVDWPRPPHFKVPMATDAPRIDGKLDDPAWETAATFTGVYLFNSTEKLNTPATTWKVLWDSDYLYFAFECDDLDLVAPEMKRDEMVYNYDCVEMFILPFKRSGMYWEIVISPAGMIFDSLHNKKPVNWGPIARISENVEGMLIGRTLNGTLNQSDDKDKGYIVEVAVPFSQLPEYSMATPKAGNKLHVMLARLDRTGGPDSEDHKAYAFIPLLSWGHNIWNYATLELQN